MQSLLYVLDFVFFLVMIVFLVLTSNYKKQLKTFNLTTKQKLNSFAKFKSEKKIIICRILWVISLISFLVITTVLFWNLSTNYIANFN